MLSNPPALPWASGRRCLRPNGDKPPSPQAPNLLLCMSLVRKLPNKPRADRLLQTKMISLRPIGPGVSGAGLDKPVSGTLDW